MLFVVTKNKVEVEEQDPVNQGEYRATTLRFEFVSAYRKLAKKAIITSNVTGKSYELPIVDDTCEIPAEILAQKGTAVVGVYGYEVEGEELVLRYSPSPASFRVIDGSYTENVENPSDVTPSQAEIYEQKIQEKITEVDELVQDLEEKRDTDYFKGDKGDKGDTGITPDITMSAAIDEKVGTPSVKVTKAGTPEKPEIELAFSSLKGEKGDAGADGLSPHIGEDGNWHVGEKDTGTKAQGPKGETGKTGATPDITMTATVDDAVGTPSVEVTEEGTPENPKYRLDFKNMKGVPGKDGFDPTIETEPTEGGTKVTITGAGGAKEFTVNDGEKGDTGNPGENGYSPQITLEQTTPNTATLSISYKDENGEVTTKSATFGGTFSNYEEEAF